MRRALALLGTLLCLVVATAAPAQAAYHDNGIRCIKAPCP